MLTFEAKAGHFGERGWRKVKFWKWLKLLLTNHVVRIRYGRK